MVIFLSMLGQLVKEQLRQYLKKDWLKLADGLMLMARVFTPLNRGHTKTTACLSPLMFGIRNQKTKQ